MKTKRIITRVFTVGALVASTISCGNVVRSTRAPAILVVNSLLATQGKATGGGQGTTNLTSDVLTIITTGGTCTTQNPCPTIFGDTGTIALTSNNQVTINRIHVAYRRTDGRNTEGVDVPFSFDTAATVTVPAQGNATTGFIIVRNQAKIESPLVELVNNGQLISAIIDVTVYGTDIVGNTVNATGSIGVTFGNFGDQ
jgi:hypothetical protein